MLNPSGFEMVLTLGMGVALTAVMWRGFVNVVQLTRRQPASSPALALSFLLLTLVVLVGPGLMVQSVPPLWTWPLWWASANGFFLMALRWCPVDAMGLGALVRFRS